jgi:hypothetical protein
MSTTVPQPQERGETSIAPSARARLSAAVARAPEAGVVAAIALAGAVFAAIWALRMPGWGVMTDELLYVKLALNSAGSLTPSPAVHGESYSQLTPVYPLVLAPLYGLLSAPAAFALAHALNAVLMGSAAIPAFLLAREAGAKRFGAYLAAALTVAAPWTVYSYFLMTEALAYPVFVWAVLACVRAVARPSWRADVVVLAAIAVAVLTRTQFVVLALVLPAAIVVHELRRLRSHGGIGAVLREHAPLVACGAIAVLALAALAATGGVGRATGNYHVLFAGDSIPQGTLSAVRPHLVMLVVGVGIVPFLAAVAWTIDALATPRERGANAVAAVMLFAVPAVVLVTAAFNRRQLGDLVQDRYEFYVVPLLFAATGAYLLGGARRRPWSLALSALLTCWILLDFASASRHTYSYVDSAHRVIKGWLGKVGVHGSEIGVALCLVALAATALLLSARSGRPARVVPAALAIATLAFGIVESAHNFHSVLDRVRAQLISYGVVNNHGRDWVDRAVPGGAKAAIVPGVVGDVQRSRGTWWDVEFWNSSITDQYDYAPAYDVTPFPERELALDWASGALRVGGPRVDYLVLPASDRRFQPRGTVVAGQDGLRLMRPAAPLRAAWAVQGTDKDGWTFAGRPATIRFYPAGGAARRSRVSVELTSTPDVAGARGYRISGGKRPVAGVLAKGAQTQVPVVVCDRPDGPTDLAVAVRGSSTLPSGEQVGLAVTGVRVSAAGGC